MIRTQVYIPDDLHRDLMLLAKQEGVNFSGLIREGVVQVLKIRKQGVKKDWKEFVGACKDKPETDSMTAVDDYYTNNVI